MSVPVAPRAFSWSFKGLGPAQRAAHCCPQPVQLACAFRGSLSSPGPGFLRDFSPSSPWNPLLSTSDRTLHFHSVLGSPAGPCVCPPSSRIHAAWAQRRRKRPWHGGLVWALGPLLLPQAGGSWRRGVLGRPFGDTAGLRADARGQQQPLFRGLGS